jgi:hypothetical protein
MVVVPMILVYESHLRQKVIIAEISLYVNTPGRFRDAD